jgi:hypothetical protein
LLESHSCDQANRAIVSALPDHPNKELPMSIALIMSTTNTIADIRQRAEAKAQRQGFQVAIQATSPPSKPFEWQIIIGWYDEHRFKCEVGIHKDLEQAAQLCLDKLKPEPDISEYIGGRP